MFPIISMSVMLVLYGLVIASCVGLVAIYGYLTFDEVSLDKLKKGKLNYTDLFFYTTMEIIVSFVIYVLCTNWWHLFTTYIV